jgi:hypothetical protein
MPRLLLTRPAARRTPVKHLSLGVDAATEERLVAPKDAALVLPGAVVANFEQRAARRPAADRASDVKGRRVARRSRDGVIPDAVVFPAQSQTW